MSNKKYDKIKNFSSSIPIDRTIMTIEKMLANHGVISIHKEYGDFGVPSKIVFVVKEREDTFPVKIPVNVDGMIEAFKQQVKEGLLTKKYSEMPWCREQAARTAWRNALDLIEIMLWHVYMRQASMKEVFLPWVYSEKLDSTIYEYLEEKQFDLEQLPNHKE